MAIFTAIKGAINAAEQLLHSDETPKWQSLQSTAISQMKYDKKQQILEVEFHGGRVYTLNGVPPDIAEGLATASSAGHYFHAQIKGRY